MEPGAHRKVNLSAVVMHHPARADRIPALLRSCAPLTPRVVVDPDPSGPASPLRTAKRAWAAIAAGATHHVVLQDDIIPMPGFARQLAEAVASCPDRGIALFVHQKSPHNAYLARRAAAAGAAFAQLAPIEWTPTLGLVLPAADARGLAAHLARLPDELLDDDDFVTPFCTSRGLAVLATVPNLLEHGDAPSLSGYEEESERLATVFDPGWQIPDGHWHQPPVPAGATDAFAIELRDSRCLIRFPRPLTGEPLLHPFGWYWHDWCELIGVDPGRVVAGADRFARTLTGGTPGEADLVPWALAHEIWAAGYLLGVDAAAAAARPARRGCDFATAVLHQTMRSWIKSGLSPADLEVLAEPARKLLVECGLSAVAAGAGREEELHVG